MANSADPDQLASSDLHCLQNRVYLGSAGQWLILHVLLRELASMAELDVP